MPGSAVLGSNLVDELVPVADEIRAELYPDLGVRQHRVYVEKWRWSGTERGDGNASQLSSLEITPRPVIDEDALRAPLPAGGQQDEGTLVLTGVSLTYTEAELTGGVLLATDSYFWKVVDGNGQSIQVRWYQLDDPPKADREREIAWRVTLRRVEGPV